MKQTFLVLVVLLIASPALARVDFDCTNDGNEVTVTWTVVADTNLVRAFALDVNCTADIDKNSFTGLDPNYWVYPGSIDVNEGGVVIGFGNPVCTGPNDGTELKPYTSTIEMGSLYKVGVEDPPLSSGIVCKFKVYLTVGDFNVILSENAIRAGVVMEDANNDDANLPETWALTIPPTECFPSGAPYAVQYATWQAIGEPNCWCNPSTGVIDPRDIEGNSNRMLGYQCHGDADGIDSGAWTYFRIYNGDLDTVVANWQYKKTHWNSSRPQGDYKNNVLGDLNPCADVTHLDSGAWTYFQVYNDDLDRIVKNWQAKNSNFISGANCPLTDVGTTFTPPPDGTYIDPTP